MELVSNGHHEIVSKKSLLKSHEYVVFEKNCLVLSKLNLLDGIRARFDLRVGSFYNLF